MTTRYASRKFLLALLTLASATWLVWCPGCNGAHHIQHGAGAGPRWGWNGDADKPTFTSSVLVQCNTWTPPVTPENLGDWKLNPWKQTQVARICHSFVTDGQIQFLGDCTHALAGQTVPLPDYPEKER